MKAYHKRAIKFWLCVFAFIVFCVSLAELFGPYPRDCDRECGAGYTGKISLSSDGCSCWEITDGVKLVPNEMWTGE